MNSLAIHTGGLIGDSLKESNKELSDNHDVADALTRRNIERFVQLTDRKAVKSFIDSLAIP